MGDFRSLIQRTGKDSRISLGMGSARMDSGSSDGVPRGAASGPSLRNPRIGGAGGPPVSSLDPAFADVVALLHMNGTDGGFTFPNSAGRGGVFVPGGCNTSTVNVKYGTASLLTSGASSSLIGTTHADYNFGTNPWLVEFWVRPLALTIDFNAIKVYYDSRPAGLTSGNYPILYSDTADGQLKVDVGGTIRITSAAGAMTAGVFQHVAMCRAAGNTRLFVNGAQQGSTFADALTYVQATANIGAAGNSAGAANGNYDDFRMANGSTAGIYTANFTPPGQQFPDS